MKNTTFTKILPVVYCLVPFGASAVVDMSPEEGQPAVVKQGNLEVTSESVAIVSGNGLIVNGAITASGSVFVGDDTGSSNSGHIYIREATNPVFNLQSTGNIDIAGGLTINEGRTLNINPAYGAGAINVSFGSDILADGSLFVKGVGDFTAGNITAADELSIEANNITAGTINLEGYLGTGTDGKPLAYTMKFTGGTLTSNAIHSYSNLLLQGGSIDSGTIQVMGGVDEARIIVDNDITISAKDGDTNNGSLWNSAADMIVTAGGAIEIAGTVKNDQIGSKLTITADSFTVNGTDQGVSFVNAGDLEMRIAGETKLANGFDLSKMSVSNTFDLETGTLVFENGMTAEEALQMFSNKLDLFRLHVNSGEIVAGQIINGRNGLERNEMAEMDLLATKITADSIDNLGDKITIEATGSDVDTINIAGNVNNNVISGTSDYDLKIIADNGNIHIGGNLSNTGNAVLGGTSVEIDGDVSNSGTLSIKHADVETGAFAANSLTNVSGTTEIWAKDINISGALSVHDGMLELASNGTEGSITIGSVYSNGGSFRSTAQTTDITGGIKQLGGSLAFYSSDVTVGGDITATDLLFQANADGALNINISGSVFGNTDFINLDKMTIGGDYIFDDNSRIAANIHEKSLSEYWATVKLNEYGELIGFENIGNNPEPLISVNGEFIYNPSESLGDLSGTGTKPGQGALQEGQIGINLTDIVDQGTAIWFLKAENGLVEMDFAEKIRNLNVNFCNADGTICFNYLDALNPNNGDNEDLPAYIATRDTDGDGIPDSLYVVFNPEYGGPVEVFKIQPIVARVLDHTYGEYVSAGALDNMIAGQLLNKKFYNDTPVEVITHMFDNSNLETMSDELYKRMEYYNTTKDGTALARFSRLFQAREAEQLLGTMVLNEHASFRSFEDRMLDEFIWNRNRDLKKAWLDIDFGFFNQKASDDKDVDGERFSVSGGFDWQTSETTILGVTGRISHTSGSNFDEMDLSYGDYKAKGRVDINVADTNFALGGYMMKTLGDKTRLYGNAFLDLHLFGVDRQQNYVSSIDGSGTAFSLISEWGLMHDLLNQYIVGNAYARIGYNMGLDVAEKASGDNYMDFRTDSYMILTPGYSLVAQKRIYPSSWFQIRPYASVGVEYDVLGAPDFVDYKFAVAHDYTKYDVELDPLWANAGAGIEFVSAVGLQFGIDYRYQYNSVLQLHNIKISGSYRF